MAETREELLEGYAHPYLRWLPVAWGRDHVAFGLSAAITLATATALWDVLGDAGAPTAMVVLSVLVAAVALGRTAWITLLASLAIRERTEDWRPDDSDLAGVRRKRPHAPDADPEVAHDEYAVGVDESGHLVTWRFRPLAYDEPVRDGEFPVAGTPRYSAAQVQWDAFDPMDAAVAAEQLAAAQEHAAALETAAAERAVREIEAADRAQELARETSSTARALRGITGQSAD